MSKTVITDYTFPDLDIERSILEPLATHVVGGQGKTPQQLIEMTADADYVITQFAPVNGQVIDAMRHARIIVRYGIGVDNVDLAAAQRNQIAVCNVPDYCIDEVADHTLALVLDATRRLTTHWDRIRSGKWGMATPVPAMKTLADMTVGVVGFGRIGRQVAVRLRAFRPKILVHDPVVPPEQIVAAGATPVTLDDLLAGSDLLTLHCPSNAHTRRIINAASIAKMKSGAILVNVGRGDLVDPSAAVDALRSGQISFAALDVWDPEPLPPDSPLLSMDNVVLTPHIASVSVKAVRALREGVAHAVARLIRNEPLQNVVNGVPVPRVGRC